MSTLATTVASISEKLIPLMIRMLAEKPLLYGEGINNSEDPQEQLFWQGKWRSL